MILETRWTSCYPNFVDWSPGPGAGRHHPGKFAWHIRKELDLYFFVYLGITHCWNSRAGCDLTTPDIVVSMRFPDVLADTFGPRYPFDHRLVKDLNRLGIRTSRNMDLVCHQVGPRFSILWTSICSGPRLPHCWSGALDLAA